MNQVLYERLCEVASNGAITRYSEVAPLVGLDMSKADDRNRMSELLCEISRHEHQLAHPLLSVVVIHVDDNSPGNGFFALAKELGLLRSQDRLVYFAEELARVHNHWRS